MQTLGNLYVKMNVAQVKREEAKEEAKREAAKTLLDQISADEEMEMKRLETVYSLKSPRELADLAERKDMNRPLSLWLYKERAHIKIIVEALFHNPTVSDDIKKEIGVRYRLTPKAAG